MDSAWDYQLSDGSRVDSENCICFRHINKSCPIHGKDNNARLVPKKQFNDDFGDINPDDLVNFPFPPHFRPWEK